MRLLLAVVLSSGLLSAGCAVEDQIGQFGQCPEGTKVSGVDPLSSDVLCSPDQNTLLEAGMGLSISGNTLSADMFEVAARLPVAPGYRYGLAARYVDDTTIEVRAGVARDSMDRDNILLRNPVQATITDQATTDLSNPEDDWYWIWVIGDSAEIAPAQAFINSSRTIAPSASGRFDRARLIGAVRIEDGALVPFRQIGQYQFRVIHRPTILYGADDQAALDFETFVDATPPGTTQATIVARLPTDKLIMFGQELLHPGLLYSDGIATLASSVPIDNGAAVVDMVTPIVPPENDDAFVVVTGYEWGSQEDFTGTQ